MMMKNDIEARLILKWVGLVRWIIIISLLYNKSSSRRGKGKGKLIPAAKVINLTKKIELSSSNFIVTFVHRQQHQPASPIHAACTTTAERERSK